MDKKVALTSAPPAPPSAPPKPANNRRGAPHRELALRFVTKFPVGTEVSMNDFDTWVWEEEAVPKPTDFDKGSDAWQAYLQRRHQLRYNINRAGAHPRMTDLGGTPFVIESVSLGKLVVRAPHQAIQRSNIAADIDKLMTGKRKQLRYLQESADWDILPAAERVLAQNVYRRINEFGEEVALKTRHLTDEFHRLEAELTRAVKAGQLIPRNGGIKAITDGGLVDESDDDAQAEPIPALISPGDES